MSEHKHQEPRLAATNLSKERLCVSVSGGETSAFMAQELLANYNDIYEMCFVMANTGQERRETFEFLRQMDEEWGFPIHVLEAVTHEGRIGCTHRLVSLDGVAMKGEPFEAVIDKYGIPNQKYPHCTRELKLNPIRSYMASIGWDSYFTAIGIRVDEPSRIRADAEAAKIIYPLVTMFPTDKGGVNRFWEDHAYRLNLKSYQGNCTWCWKKNINKLVAIAQETPEVFEFPARMEEKYGTYADGRPRRFFREQRTTGDIIGIAELVNSRIADDGDEDSGCSESCEPFGQQEFAFGEIVNEQTDGR
jgi:hypothetical protein